LLAAGILLVILLRLTVSLLTSSVAFLKFNISRRLLSDVFPSTDLSY